MGSLIEEEQELAQLTARFRREEAEAAAERERLQKSAQAKLAAQAKAAAEEAASARLQAALGPKWAHIQQRREMEKELRKGKKKKK